MRLPPSIALCISSRLKVTVPDRWRRAPNGQEVETTPWDRMLASLLRVGSILSIDFSKHQKGRGPELGIKKSCDRHPQEVMNPFPQRREWFKCLAAKRR
jgi:hypothetical protein